MAGKSKRGTGKLANVQFNIEAQPGKQQMAMDLMPNVMIYGGAAGCVDNKTEYLSKDGWKPISEYSGEMVAQFNPKNNKLSFCQPYYVCEDNEKDGFYRIENSSGIDQCLTMGHRFVFYKKKKSKKHFEITVGDLLALQQVGKPLTGYIETINGKRIPFNLQKDPSTHLKIYKFFPEDTNKYCFETETGFLFLRRGKHEFVTGNSGKSRLLLLKALKFAYNDPKFFGVIFRRNTGPLKNGGLFDSAKDLYAPLDPHVKEQAMEIHFTSTGGGRIKFDHLEHESTVRSHQG